MTREDWIFLAIALVAGMIAALPIPSETPRDVQALLDDLEALSGDAPDCKGKSYARYRKSYTRYELDRTLEDRIVAYQGRRYSPYDRKTYSENGQTDIEHIVARKEAHESGLCEQGVQAIRSFVTSLPNLTLSTPLVNRTKADQDASEWMPVENRCWYAARVVKVKTIFNLSVDDAERTALRNQLSICGSVGMA